MEPQSAPALPTNVSLSRLQRLRLALFWLALLHPLLLPGAALAAGAHEPEQAPAHDTEAAPDLDAGFEQAPASEVEAEPELDAAPAVDAALEELDERLRYLARHRARANSGSPWDLIGDIEREMGERQLGIFGLTADHDPWGKTICDIHMSQLPIFLPEEPIPGFLNRLHVTSREAKVRSALTFEVGDSWDALDIRDTERSLRDPMVYVVVTVLPVQSEEEGCVEALVVTRDLWSLRLAWDVQSVGSTVTNLYFAVTDTNLFGTNSTFGVHYAQTLGNAAVGPTLFVPRIGGTGLDVFESFELVINREDGGIEGSRNTFTLEEPLNSSRDDWGWRLMAAHRHEIDRRFIGRDVRRHSFTHAGRDWEIGERWLVTEVDVEGVVTRSFGQALKHNFSLGGALSLAEHSVWGASEELPEDVVQRFAELRLPRDERSLGPIFRYELFENRYLTLVNYETFDLSEELRLGAELTVDVMYSEPYIGSERRFVTGGVQASWTQSWSDSGFATLQLSQRGRNGGYWSDLDTSLTTKIVTPPWAAGRFVLLANYHLISENEANVRFLHGGDTSLRGFTNGAFESARYLRTNLEWRSLPINIWGIRLGMVTFFDSLTTMPEPDEPGVDDYYFYPAVGFGFRVVIPQLMANVRFLDIGFPLVDANTLRIGGRDTGFPLPLLSFGADQAF